MKKKTYFTKVDTREWHVSEEVDSKIPRIQTEPSKGSLTFLQKLH